ncbi:MAG: hypothetical protein IPP72_15135 [Chitinophagaceae bacterium]|nr:hypothetical protein [Chitinophagaceae bacterium]
MNKIMRSGNLFFFVLFIIVMIIISRGGPALSRWSEKRYRERIDKNGKIIAAEIYKRKTHKGKTVHYQYKYNNRDYTNNDQSDSLFNLLRAGDEVLIKIDSLQPGDAYIVDMK